VGEVRAISLIAPEGEGQIRVKLACRVKKDVQIPVDSVIWVNTLGLLGEKYIEIIPGKNFARVLSETEELNGMDPISMQEVTDMANKLVHNVDDVVKKIKNGEGTVGKLLNDDTIYNDIEALVKDLRKHPWKLFWKTKQKKEDK
jgi:phospholipid/cholesterol/gamma-HCH transport system substrate-binding protein